MTDKENYFNDLEEIITDKMYIGNSIDELDKEIENNHWQISIAQEMCSITTTEDFVKFFEAVIENRIEQIAHSKCNHGMIFYLWFDEQACQLRFNLISDFHTTLPFKCKLTFIDNPHEIIQDFLDNNYHDGIPLEQLDLSTKEEDENFEYTLKVFCLNISKDNNKKMVWENK